MFDSQIDELEQIASEVTSNCNSDYLYPQSNHSNLAQKSQLNDRKKLPIGLRVGAVVSIGAAYLMMLVSFFNYTQNSLMNSIAHNHLPSSVHQSITAIRKPIKTHS